MATLERKNDETWVCLDENLDVSTISEFRSTMKKVVTRKAPYVLDGSAVTRVHTAALQVLLALITTIKSKDKSFRWESASEPLSSAAATLGLKKELGIKK